MEPYLLHIENSFDPSQINAKLEER